jgi:surface protein
MANKFPTNQSFQRLNNSPLDETMIFDTLAQAQDYASNNPTAYEGQVIHVKNARTADEINEEVLMYEETCYIDIHKNVKPICSFTYEAMGMFFNLMYEILDGPTEETKSKLDALKELMYDNYTHEYTEVPTGDYKTQPWHPLNYNDKQIGLKMTKSSSGTCIGNMEEHLVIEGTTYTIEDITIRKDGMPSYYKVIHLDGYPTRISFLGGFDIEKVIHMCETYFIKDMYAMFHGCTHLIDILDINEWNVSNVTTMAYMFVNCPLKSLDFSNWRTYNLTNMSHMFYGCGKLTELDLSSFITNNVTDMKWMFVGCKALKSVNVSTWNTSNVTTMNSMFDMCFELKELNLSNFNISKVTDISAMFNSCKSLVKLDISNFNITSETIIESIFRRCHSLELSNIIMTNCSSYTIEQLTEEHELWALYP